MGYSTTIGGRRGGAGSRLVAVRARGRGGLAGLGATAGITKDAAIAIGAQLAAGMYYWYQYVPNGWDGAALLATPTPDCYLWANRLWDGSFTWPAMQQWFQGGIPARIASGDPKATGLLQAAVQAVYDQAGATSTASTINAAVASVENGATWAQLVTAANAAAGGGGNGAGGGLASSTIAGVPTWQVALGVGLAFWFLGGRKH